MILWAKGGKKHIRMAKKSKLAKIEKLGERNVIYRAEGDKKPVKRAKNGQKW